MKQAKHTQRRTQGGRTKGDRHGRSPTSTSPHKAKLATSGHRCLVCRRRMKDTRPDARTCSTACRKALSRGLALALDRAAARLRRTVTPVERSALLHLSNTMRKAAFQHGPPRSKSDKSRAPIAS